MADEEWEAHCKLTSLLAAIPAKRTVDAESAEPHQAPASEESSSALLESFARSLCSERTRSTCTPMLRGLGGGSGMSCVDSDIWSSHSDSGRVVLASTTGGSGCSCSPRFPTPTASTLNLCRNPKAVLERRARVKAASGNGNGFGLNLGQSCAINNIPFTVELLEDLMGFPRGWASDYCEATETPSPQQWGSSSDDG